MPHPGRIRLHPGSSRPIRPIPAHPAPSGASCAHPNASEWQTLHPNAKRCKRAWRRGNFDVGTPCVASCLLTDVWSAPVLFSGLCRPLVASRPFSPLSTWQVHPAQAIFHPVCCFSSQPTLPRSLKSLRLNALFLSVPCACPAISLTVCLIDGAIFAVCASPRRDATRGCLGRAGRR